MKQYQYLIFIGIVLTIFCWYAVSRETIIGADSAAFLGYSCGHPPVGKDGSPIGLAAYRIQTTQWFFEHLPCNMLLFKAIACLNLLVCVLILAKTGELFDIEYGWLLGFFVFMNGLFLSFLLQLEEGQLAFPFLFAASYFLLKHIKEKKTWYPVWFDKNLLIGFFFVLLAGLLWKGAIFYVPLFALYFYPVLLLFNLLILFGWYFIIPMFGAIFAGCGELYAGIFLGKQVMQESMVGIGLIQQWGLLLGLLNRNKFLWLALIYTVGLCFLAQRFSMLLLPFLGVAFILYLKQKPDYRPTLLIFSLFFLIFTVYSTPNFFPNNTQIHVIQSGVQVANGEKVCNLFGTGWWIKYYNGKTDFYSGFPDCNAETWHGVVIDSNSTYLK